MQLFNTIAVAAVALSLTVSALPSPGWGRGKIYARGPKLCSCAGAVLPEPAGGYTATYTAPEPNLKLTRVVLGVGTQNYTCKGAPTDAPVPNGAYAKLYDASCLAVREPRLLHSLPKALLGGSTGEVRTLNVVLSMANTAGLHIFPEATTPVFDFLQGDGRIFVGKKKAEVPAPAADNAGKFGTVAWLNLDPRDSTVGFARAYRVVTAGGKAPPTCEDRPASFEMPYATEYWFYSDKRSQDD